MPQLARVASLMNGVNAGLLISASASRSSGVAPLAVFFDASATTVPGISYPFHELKYTWDFGDPAGAAMFAYGSKATASSKNAAMGPVAAHVFETYSATPYTVTCTITDGVSTWVQTIAITVTDPDVVFATTKTICYSTGALAAGGPVGCTYVPNVVNLATSIAANMATGTRHLLKKGDTFTLTTPIVINGTGPGILGAFGAGATPIIQTPNSEGISISSALTPTLSDWRFMDLALTGLSQVLSIGFFANGGMSKLTFLRVSTTLAHQGIQLSDGILDLRNAVPFTIPIWDEVSIVDSSFTSAVGGAGGYGVYLVAKRFSFLGNLIDDTTSGEHGMRNPYLNKGVISNNTIKNAAASKLNLTIRGPVFGGSNTYPAGTYTEKIVVSDNKFEAGALSAITVSNGSSDPANSDERQRDEIFERNWFTAGAQTQVGINQNSTYTTIRNNVFDFSNAHATFGNLYLSLTQTTANTIVPPSSFIWFYNNTGYSSTTTANSIFLNLEKLASNGLPTNIFWGGNLAYTPSDTGALMVYDPQSVNPTLSAANSSNAQMRATSPNFTSVAPFNPTNAKPAGGSYAIGAGTPLSFVRADFFNAVVPTPRDLGAVNH